MTVEIIREEGSNATSIIRYPTVKCKRHKDVAHTFRNVASINRKPALRINGEWVIYDQHFYDRPAATNAELLALYEETERLIADADAEAELEGVTPDHAVVRYVPIAALTLPPPGSLDGDIDWARQCRVNLPHAADIFRFHEASNQGDPQVTLRLGVDADGHPTVFARTVDGTHRTTCAVEKGETKIKAKVSIVHTAAEEARAYMIANVARNNTGTMDLFRSRYAGEDPRVKLLIDIADEYGFELALTNSGTKKWPRIAAPAAVEKIFVTHGENVLRRVFSILEESGLNWQCTEAVTSDMIAGLAAFVVRFEIPGYAHPVMIEDAIRQTSPQALMTAAQLCTTIDAREKLRENCESNTLGSQTGRCYSLCMAIFDAYTRAVKSAVKNKRPGAAQFQRLWNIWVSKDLIQLSPEEKIDLIARQQQKLARLRVQKAVSGVLIVDAQGNPVIADMTPVFKLPDATDSRYAVRGNNRLVR
jgi:hypothetical protein